MYNTSQVRHLVLDGHEVIYYSFDEFKDKIESIGAKFIRCDDYLMKLKDSGKDRNSRRFSELIKMSTETTLVMGQEVCNELKILKPDCIVYDSMCLWGKLFAKKLNIPRVCSTTTFAFNDKSARLMKQSIGNIMDMILSMGKIKKRLKLLNENGYEVKDMISLIKNDNDTNTIVYTSKEFQPCAESFSNKYFFIGPSVHNIEVQHKRKIKKTIYISLGTVNNNNIKFYKNCIKAFEKNDVNVIMSVGKNTDISLLGSISDNFEVKHSVNQIEVLQNSDVFISHCGMNSANESLYYSVPMVLYPQQSEQGLVAKRIEELGAGVMLKSSSSKEIEKAVMEILNNSEYKENSLKISDNFKKCGGGKEGAKAIERLITLEKIDQYI